MVKNKVSVVKYLNSVPFIYGLKNHEVHNDIVLSLDSPAECLDKLVSSEVDLGLVPVVMKNTHREFIQVTDYCIGADGKVLSVILVSGSELKDIKRIILDGQSRTSVLLAKLLCRDLWLINPVFVNSGKGFLNHRLQDGEAALVIGDKAIGFAGRTDILVTDLSLEWKKLTGLPFVFAVWASRHRLSSSFVKKFNAGLQYGLARKAMIAGELKDDPAFSAIDVYSYLDKNIIHEINPLLTKGMNLFLHLIRNLDP